MSNLTIGPLWLEWANPGQPFVIRKYYVQEKRYDADHPEGYWADAQLDVNLRGVDRKRAQDTLASIKGGQRYEEGTELRIVKRTCTVETEVIG